MSSHPREFDVFLSFASGDQGFANKLAEALRSEGLSVWHASDELPLGASIPDRVRTGMRASDAVLLIASDDSAKSSWVSFELGLALGTDKRVIVVANPEAENQQLPLPLKNVSVLSRTLDEAGIADQVKKLLERGRSGT